MRISDWSSDVCSSDLAYPEEGEERLFTRLREIRPQAWPNSLMVGYADELLGRGGRLTAALRRHYGHQIRRDPTYLEWMARLGRSRELDMARSEEHTSELQSLMRISYAVFCLKKKTTHYPLPHTPHVS